MISRLEFIAAYTGGNKELYEQLKERGRYAVRCMCGQDGCAGWQMPHTDEMERFLERLFALAARRPLVSLSEAIEEVAPG